MFRTAQEGLTTGVGEIALPAMFAGLARKRMICAYRVIAVMAHMMNVQAGLQYLILVIPIAMIIARNRSPRQMSVSHM
jgi:hypothetical protein